MSEEQQAPVVRMDKSRDFATCHGERTPGNSHVGVHFYQNGLPFDAQGVMVADHPDFEPESEKPSKQAILLRERAEKLMAKAIKSAKPKVEGEAAEDGNDDSGASDGPANLETWARGETRVQWNEVTQAIAKRFHVRVSSKAAAIELLVQERVVAIGDLSDEHRKLLDE
jgi:hypothetical protein